MYNCQFKEIFVVKNFEVENDVLDLDHDCYLSIVKFLDSSTVRKKLIKYFVLFSFLFSLLMELVMNHLNK
jgi:hypothetical protein